ncbi:MAG: hypothetical protein AWM53_01819 [Candidatus Dichloromethanomonas elyunquensis]|nr:MAG: hypothetical protein AWM53_01819 [Candidatus Dichloromethanomonas elyunquensis]
MHFTEGQLREYERIMREKPGYDRKSLKAPKRKDFRLCSECHKHCDKCGKEQHALFGD